MMNMQHSSSNGAPEPHQVMIVRRQLFRGNLIAIIVKLARASIFRMTTRPTPANFPKAAPSSSSAAVFGNPFGSMFDHAVGVGVPAPLQGALGPTSKQALKPCECFSVLILFATESYVHGLAARKGNCLHLTGVEGPLGLRINGKASVSVIMISILHALTPSFLTGVYAPQDEPLQDTTKSRSYTHASSAGVRAVHGQSDLTWRIFDSDVCVAHWTEALPSASPESLHRA